MLTGLNWFDSLLVFGQGVATAPYALVAAVVSGPQVNLTWSAAAVAGESGFSIERRDATAGGSFAEVATVLSNVYSYTGDAGPFTARHRYAYRVVVVGGASDGQVSNEVAVFGGSSQRSRLRRMRLTNR